MHQQLQEGDRRELGRAIAELPVLRGREAICKAPRLNFITLTFRALGRNHIVFLGPAEGQVAGPLLDLLQLVGELRAHLGGLRTGLEISAKSHLMYVYLYIYISMYVLLLSSSSFLYIHTNFAWGVVF